MVNSAVSTPNRRGRAPRRFVYSGALTALLACAATGLLFAFDSGAKRSPLSPRRTQDDPASHQLYEEVGNAARRAPGAAGLWSSGQVDVLTAMSSGGRWRLAYGATPRRTCLVLVLPNLLSDGSCGYPARLAPRPVLVSAGSRPGPGGADRPADTVVYGMVSPRVRELRLQLSDCSVMPLSVDARPLFLAFLSRAKLAKGVSPLNLTATLASGRSVRRPLAAPGAARSCSSG